MRGSLSLFGKERPGRSRIVQGADTTAVTARPAPVPGTTPRLQFGGDDKTITQETSETERGDETDKDLAYPSLILVGWSPARLSLQDPPEATAVKTHFRAIRDHLDMDGIELGLWVPRQCFLERLRTRLEFALSAVSADEMFAELDEECLDLMFDSIPASPAPPPPPNYLEARQRLRKALRADPHRQCNRDKLTRAFLGYEERLEQELIQPLYRATAAPHKRNLQVAFMDLCRLFHRLTPFLDEGLAQTHPMDLLRSAESIPRARLMTLSTLVRDIVALSREMRS
jgi:hypothetical protein